MSMYKYVRDLWKQPKENLGIVWRNRLIEWKTQEATVRVDKPTRIDRARSLGYRAKQGYIIIRQRVMKHKRQRPKFEGGRRSKHMRRKKIVKMNYGWIAEQRAEKKFTNCTVLNSYYVGGDGTCVWYEVILVDRDHPAIKADPRINWICNKRGRANRGLTSMADQSRETHF